MTQHHRTKEWATVTRIMRPRLQALINSGTARCIDCGRPIQPGEMWQVGHIVSATEAKAAGWTTAQINAATNLGPSHSGAGRRCNQRGGGKLGAAKVNAKRKEDARLPKW